MEIEITIYFNWYLGFLIWSINYFKFLKKELYLPKNISIKKKSLSRFSFSLFVSGWTSLTISLMNPKLKRNQLLRKSWLMILSLYWMYLDLCGH